MEKITKKTILIILLTIMIMPLLCSTFSYEVRAIGGEIIDPDNVTSSLSSDQTTGTAKLDKIGTTIIGMLRGVGIVISVAVLMVIGIKYMMVSVEEKAQYKKAMMPYLLGATMVFSISVFLSIIIEIAKAIK